MTDEVVPVPRWEQPAGRTVRFDLEVSQEKHLAIGTGTMHAVLIVTSQGLGFGPLGGGVPGRAGEVAGAAAAAEVIIVDCSGSMDRPPTKMAAARRATAAAIDVLPDGVLFAVVEGTERARLAYPGTPRLVAAAAQTRAEAKAAVARLVAGGGTAMGSWLRQAGELLDAHPSAVRHAILLTDGRNLHETSEQLDQALAGCAGRFVCDARGVGEDWDPKQLRRITQVLRGTADAVRDVADLAADFRSITQAAMRKVVPDLSLRVRTPPWARLRYVKQSHPTTVDITGQATRPDERTVLVSLGSWGDETREYHLCLDLDSAGGPVGQDVRAARVDLLVADRPVGAPGAVLVRWTDDPVASTRIDPRVSHHLIQEELSHALEAGYDAYDAGDRGTAATEWGRAVKLATALGNTEILTRLARLVDIVDPDAGAVRLKDELRRSDLLAVEVGSVISTRSPVLSGPDPVGQPPAGPSVTCACGRVSPPGSRICTRCGQPLSAADDPIRVDP